MIKNFIWAPFVKLCLEAKLTLKDQNGNTPLHYSIIGHRDDMLSTLIQNRVDPGIINQGQLRNIALSILIKFLDGYNAIHLAAMKNSSSALRIILSESISNNR